MNDIHALSGAYAVDALDDAERVAFEAHLAVCGDCRIEVAELREATGLLPELTSAPPPPALRDAVLSEIAKVRPLPPLRTPPTESEPSAAVVPIERRRRRLPLLAAAAAVVVLLGGAVAVIQPWTDETSEAPNMADQVMAADDAQEVRLDLADGATARLVRSVSQGRAVVITQDMPSAPEGRDYQLWLQTPDGEMVDAGLMPDRPDQTMLLTGDATDAVGAGITVEPDGGSPQPTSDPIVFFDLADG
ncbi:anti-sigma factor [Nocardioides alcanivorans]|uniref:anti-sigma factor n=1 Tax=Nocardioides alcanivorans TaxID=2897352 RepID=UPI001F1745A8|nr:anti-sigma factor [Nocardioides alcanivorans]